MRLGKAGLSFLGLMSLPAMWLAAPAAAAERGYGQEEERVRVYVGGTLGGTKLKEPLSVFGDSSPQSDVSDFGYKGFVGIELEPHSSIEFAYIDFGTFNSDQPLVPFTGEWTGRAINISYVGGAAFNKWVTFNFRVGGQYWKVEDEGTNVSGPFQSDESGASLSFGLGFQFNFGRWVSTRLDYEFFSNIGNDITGSSDIELISASLMFRI